MEPRPNARSRALHRSLSRSPTIAPARPPAPARSRQPATQPASAATKLDSGIQREAANPPDPCICAARMDNEAKK
ncbi:hypothetical protein PAHAL_3G129200 [Panicum hallii]|uniref:Uncharacterized protein n=1 Tax=Panicum hallii TaxID=206008 RepID=A0A2T8KI51_9POAL|nr:hypothetical protein PAHAL_3G129200 [Panicum hallii]